MAQVVYCWRCQMNMPMLDEAEWQDIATLMTDPMNSDLREIALARYLELTGYRETNINAIWHHRVSLFGPPCDFCGKPLRTPRAKWCAACGATAGTSAKAAHDLKGLGTSYTSPNQPQFRNQHEKEAYWNHARDFHERIFSRLEREERTKRYLLWLGLIAALTAFGYFFGPL